MCHSVNEAGLHKCGVQFSLALQGNVTYNIGRMPMATVWPGIGMIPAEVIKD